VSGFCWFLFVEPDLALRLAGLNLAYSCIAAVVARELHATPDKGPAGGVLFAVSMIASLNFLARALFLVSMHEAYQTFEDIYGSNYWTTTLLANAIVSLLLAFGLIAATVLDMFNTLQSDSRTDPLSGLLNRRGFEEQASEALQSSRRMGLPVALVLADIDHFKSVNDRFGHAAGDDVIAAFASGLRAAAGERGIVGRLGGEEFAVMLPASNLTVAQLFAEGIRVSLSRRDHLLPAGIQVTASFGIAAPEGAEKLAALLACADQALYRAKQEGRDTVRVSRLQAEPFFEPIRLSAPGERRQAPGSRIRSRAL
jgi:diguanylate cyclase (GGDEF)-like protein